MYAAPPDRQYPDHDRNVATAGGGAAVVGAAVVGAVVGAAVPGN